MAQQQHGQQFQPTGQQGIDRNDARQDAQHRQNGAFPSRQFGARSGTRGRQQSQEAATGQQFGAQPFQSMAEVALRGTALLFDLQMETARSIMRTQARTAALLGAPDYSDLFRFGDDRARRLFAAGAEQMLNSARQARETVFEVQRQIGRLAEQQTIGLAEEMREQMEAMTRHTEEGLQQIKHVAEAEAGHAEDVLHEAMHGDERVRGPEGEQRAPSRGDDTSRSEGPAQGFDHVAAHDGQRAANEAPGAENDAHPEANLANVNEPPPRERERGRARR